MGQYIQSGVCYRIKVAKRMMEECNVSYQEFVEGLAKEIDLELYEAREIKNGYIFTLKDEVLEKDGLTEFLSEQYKLLNVDKKKAEEIIGRLNEATTADEIIEFAEEKRYENFQYVSVYDNIYCKPWGERIMVEYDLVKQNCNTKFN